MWCGPQSYDSRKNVQNSSSHLCRASELAIMFHEEANTSLCISQLRTNSRRVVKLWQSRQKQDSWQIWTLLIVPVIINSYLWLTYLWLCLPVTLHTCDSAYLWLCLPVTLLTCDTAYLWLCLPVALLTCDSAYLWLCLPVTRLTCDSAYLWLFLPVTFLTCDSSYQ